MHRPYSFGCKRGGRSTPPSMSRSNTSCIRQATNRPLMLSSKCIGISLTMHLSMVSLLLWMMMMLIPTVKSVDNTFGWRPNGWSLPPVGGTHHTKNQHAWLQQCESVIDLLRGGGGGYDDDWNSGRYGVSQQETEEEEYYSGKDYYNGGGGRGRRSTPSNVYDDYQDYSPAQNSRSNTSNNNNSIIRILKHGDRQIGLALLGSGLALTILGFALFFNRALLRLGNLLFILGVPLTLGPARTLSYFSQKEKIRASTCLTLGIFLVLMGHPTFGIVAEVFGLLNIFGNMFPILMIFLKQLPVVGPMLQQQKRATAKTTSKRRKDEHYDDVEEEEDYYKGDSRGNQPQSQRRNYQNDDYPEETYYDKRGYYQ